MLIILDRDGVINEDSPDYIRSPQDFIPYPQSLQAIAHLNGKGHKVVVATNQSGIGRGYYTHEVLAAIHEKLNSALSDLGGHLDGIYYCPHVPKDNCQCRKPKPGLLKQIAKDFSVDLTSAYFVGDSLRDIQAAQSVGVKPILVLTGKGQETYSQHNKNELVDVSVYQDLAAFVNDRL